VSFGFTYFSAKLDAHFTNFDTNLPTNFAHFRTILTSDFNSLQHTNLMPFGFADIMPVKLPHFSAKLDAHFDTNLPTNFTHFRAILTSNRESAPNNSLFSRKLH
jgi:hypothetical protein